MRISEIKAILDATAIENLETVLAAHQADERKGVQTLIASYQRKIQKHTQEMQRIDGLWEYENIYFDKGHQFIAGLDEVGRGPLAGPVVAASVILPRGCRLPVNDSKKLSKDKRETLYHQIKEVAISIGVGCVPPEVIDDINILEATKLAMLQAIDNMPVAPDFLLLDALTLNKKIGQRPIIGGDGKSANIAAASIIAKVTRDAMMDDYDKQYPQYHFVSNKGYGTEAHMQALLEYGLTPIHRRSFLKGHQYAR